MTVPALFLNIDPLPVEAWDTAGCGQPCEGPAIVNLKIILSPTESSSCRTSHFTAFSEGVPASAGDPEPQVCAPGSDNRIALFQFSPPASGRLQIVPGDGSKQ